MFVTDETVNSKSHVIFYRCSLCVSEHVSSEPAVEAATQQSMRQASDSFQQGSLSTQYAL